MVTRNRPSPRAVLFGLLLAFLLCGNPQAQGGGCIGASRARVVRFFEILSYRIQKTIDDLAVSLRTVAMEFPRQAIPAGVFVSKVKFRHECRETVHGLLTGETYHPDKTADELKSLIEKALSLARTTIFGQKTPPELQQQFKSETLADLRKVFARTAGSFRICQAVRQKSPEPCSALEPLDASLKTDCGGLALQIGVFLQGHCSDEAVDLMATTWSRKASAIKIFCQAIKEQRPEHCSGIPDPSPRDQAWCRALSGDGEKACDESVLGTEGQQECRSQVRIREVMTGKLPLDVVSKESIANPLLETALLAAREDTACDLLALDVFSDLTRKLFPYSY